MVYRFGEFRFEVEEFRLSRQGAPLPLEPKALHLLLYLLQNRRRLVRKQELLDCVWHEATVTDNALTRVVALLRRVLQDDRRAPRFIETVPTAGYRFIAAVMVVEESSPVETRSASAAGAQRWRRWRSTIPRCRRRRPQ
jgi:DNA-binding winged helix-turn-helix (wHTH) protein